jgi:hypothetical protein
MLLTMMFSETPEGFSLPRAHPMMMAVPAVPNLAGVVHVFEAPA